MNDYLNTITKSEEENLADLLMTKYKIKLEDLLYNYTPQINKNKYKICNSPSIEPIYQSKYAELLIKLFMQSSPFVSKEYRNKVDKCFLSTLNEIINPEGKNAENPMEICNLLNIKLDINIPYTHDQFTIKLKQIVHICNEIEIEDSISDYHDKHLHLLDSQDDITKKNAQKEYETFKSKTYKRVSEITIKEVITTTIKFHSYYFRIIKDSDIEFFSNELNVAKDIYFDISKIDNHPEVTENDYPTWTKFILDKIIDPNEKIAFMVFMYSIFYAKDKQRWACALIGEGLDGKGLLMKIFSTIVDRNHGLNRSSRSFVDTINDKTNVSEVPGIAENCRLLLLMDTKNTNIIKDGVIHSLLSGDPQTIRRLFKDSYTKLLNNKFLFASNDEPTVDMHEINQTSRLRIIRFSKEKHLYIENAADKLIDESSAFLRACKDVYFKYVKNDELIIKTELNYDPTRISINNYVESFLKEYYRKYFPHSKNIKGEMPMYILRVCEPEMSKWMEDCSANINKEFPNLIKKFQSNELVRILKNMGYKDRTTTSFNGKTLTVHKYTKIEHIQETTEDGIPPDHIKESDEYKISKEYK